MGAVATAERLGRVLELLLQRGRVRTAELSRLLGVSEVTVRRYLDRLEAEGKVRRYHGWAVPTAEPLVERSFRERAEQATAEKDRIASRAAELVPEGAAIMLTGGTTTARVIEKLRGRRDLTVITTAVNIAAEVVAWEGCRLVVTGGWVRERSYQMVGPAAVAALASLTADIAFIGVDGVSREHGLTTSDVFEAEVDAAMVRAARRVVVVADSRKLGRSALAVICPLSAVHTLITDVGAPLHICRELEEEGVEVIRV